LTLYVVRHTETHNPRDILYGRLPRFDLSARGREQAAATAEAMAELPLDVIYRSPLLRARRTAAAIAARHPGVPVRESSLLLENLHPYQGRTHAEIAKLGDRAYDPGVLGETGESIPDLVRRVARFLQMVRRRHAGGVVAAVSHADPVAALRLYLLDKELVHANLRQEAPPLGGVFRAELDGGGPPRLEWLWKPEPPPKPAKPPDEVAAATMDGANPADGDGEAAQKQCG
jgi:broad specificity phosphatase PhoE